MMKKYQKNYTLVEILAAMAVFVIICLVVMRFFSGAQRIIVNTTNSNDLHADVRVAFDLIGRDLQSIVYNNKKGVEGIYPFAHSYYSYSGSSPYTPLVSQKDNLKIFYQGIVPVQLKNELSDASGIRDYAPLLCFISNQSDLPTDADYETCEIRYTFVPAGIYNAAYGRRNNKSSGSKPFSGGALLRSCTYSNSVKNSLSDISSGRHAHDFSAFPVVDSSGKAVPIAQNRVNEVFKDRSSREFERVIGGVYRMNITCFKITTAGELKKIKMFDVNNTGADPLQRKEFNVDPDGIYLPDADWPLPSYTYPAGGAKIRLGQVGHPLPDMVKVDLYMLDSSSWNSLMNCYKLSGSTYSIKSAAHIKEAQNVLNLKLRYFTKNFYIRKVDASFL